MKRVHFFVSGNVQGVCYRYYAVRKAKLLGLKGFVKNVSEGRVEMLVEGEKDKVDEFTRFCKNNPGYSNVKVLEIKEEKEIRASAFEDFEIKYY